MTSDQIADLVRRLRDLTQSHVTRDRLLLDNAADTIEQLARELAACEGALRNSGAMVQDLNDLAKRYEDELKQIKALASIPGIDPDSSAALRTIIEICNETTND